MTPMVRIGLPVLLVFSAFCLMTAVPALAGEAAPGAPADIDDRVPTDEELVSRGATIGDILIRNENIFDLGDPREDNWLFRLANRLHIRTRRSTIANQLLFRTGDPYNRRLLDESERILRSNRYFHDARIRPVAFRGGRVDIEVLTRDVWTLRPGFSFTRVGGRNTTSLDFQETNFLGGGSAVRIARTSTFERDTNSLEFADEHLFRSRWRTGVLLSDSDDGRKRSFLLERPFYALDTRWTGGGSVIDDDRIDSLAAQGRVASRFRTRVKFLRFHGGWSGGLSRGWVRRWTLGATRDETRFSALPGQAAPDAVPEDRILAYPWIGFELLEDRFEEAKNRDQIERTEDFFLGTRLGASLGYASPGFSSDRDALIFSASLGKGIDFGERWVLTFNGTADGRVESGTARNTVVGGAARQYFRLAEKWLFFALLSADRAIRLDLDRQLLLGGDNGLRGYPARYQAGDRRFLLTLEQRFYTPWYPFRLFRLGGAVFFDMGRAWGGDFRSVPDPGLLRDVGAGLRIGSARSGLGNVIHIDVAFPLDGDPSIDRVQLLVVTKQSF
ncbi:MAG: hypothetical protein HZA60_06960 [Deltaproteobacteria bacterium]|nr:hypothetical protein [Deltaproteobacteria bacterium]